MEKTKRGDVVALRVRHGVTHSGDPTQDDCSWYLGRAGSVRRDGTVLTARIHARSADGVIHVGVLLRKTGIDISWECLTITDAAHQVAAAALLGGRWETAGELRCAILARKAQEEDRSHD